MRVFTWNGLLQRRVEVERALSIITSMVDTAKATVTRKGVRFDRGSMSLNMERGGVITLRETKAGDPRMAYFQGVYLGEDRDMRLIAIDAAEELRTTIASALRNEHPAEGLVSEGSQLRRAYAALRAAAGIAGLHHADIHLQHAWGRVPNQAMVYCNGPGPFTLRPDAIAIVTEGVEEACSVSAHGVDGSLRVTIDGACWTEEVDDGPVSVLRLVSECGLDQEQLVLVRQDA